MDYTFTLSEIFNEEVEDITGNLVYQIINKVNDKRYVGTTCISLLTRFVYGAHYESHFGCIEYGVSKKLYNSIRSHGVHNFEVKVTECTSQDSMYELERSLIEKHDAFFNGLNSSISGKIHQSIDNDARWKGIIMEVLSSLTEPLNEVSYTKELQNRYSNGDKIGKYIHYENLMDNYSHIIPDEFQYAVKEWYNLTPYEIYRNNLNSKIYLHTPGEYNVCAHLVRLFEFELELNEDNYNRDAYQALPRFIDAIFQYPHLFPEDLIIKYSKLIKSKEVFTTLFWNAEIYERKIINILIKLLENKEELTESSYKFYRGELSYQTWSYNRLLNELPEITEIFNKQQV